MRILSIQSKRLAILAGLTIVGIGLSANLRAGLQARTDGMGGTEALPVYSRSQARTGMRPYIKECSSCHGEMFNGAESGPKLSGSDFRKRWTGFTAIDLFEIVQTMPPYPDTPGKLKDDEYFAIVATILQANGLPAGDKELNKESAAAEVPLFE